MLLQIHEPGATPEPHAAERGLAVGIDLGTTNTVVAVSREGRAEVLRGPRGDALIPSVVAFDPQGGVEVGEGARRRLLDAPEQVVSSAKRLMGRGLADLLGGAGTRAHDFAEPEEGEAAGGMVRLMVSGRRLSPVEVSAEILREAKRRAESALGEAVERAVITVPAYFDDAARTATRDAARLAGLGVLRLVNEPTAAALAYGLDQGVEGLYAVYDLGGGTFDFSLLRLEKGVFQVLATGGDAALGGDDIDQAVLSRFLAEREGAGLPAAPDVGEAKLALATARLAKECLSTRESGDWVLSVGDAESRHALDRPGLEAVLAPLVARTLEISRDVLADAGVAGEALNGIVLVGGSTRVPAVRRAVAEAFGRPPLTNIDPDEVVAVGAALQAEALTSGSDTLLLDVTPLTLGIETMGGLVEAIIPRNSPIPVTKAQDFTTYEDGQAAMLIHVVQGERETVDLCRSLARFTLAGIPPMAAGGARIRVSFSVDADGLLTVSAQEKTTGTRQSVEVKPTYGLDDDEMGRMLREGMEHAREDIERRLLIEARVEARRVLSALGSALAADSALLAEGEREAIHAVAAELEAALTQADRDAINATVTELERVTHPFAQRRIDRALGQALSGVNMDDLATALDAGRSLPPQRR